MHGNVNINNKENSFCNDPIDINSIMNDQKKLCKKTIQNKASAINKILGSSPIQRKQVLDYVLNKLPVYEKENVINTLSPSLDEKIKGDLFKKLRQDNPKSDIAYDILSKINEDCVQKTLVL